MWQTFLYVLFFRCCTVAYCNFKVKHPSLLITSLHFCISWLPPSIHPSSHLQAWLLIDDHLWDSYPIGASSCLSSTAVGYQSVASGRVQVGLDCGGREGMIDASLPVWTSLDRHYTITACLYFSKQTQFWFWTMSLFYTIMPNISFPAGTWELQGRGRYRVSGRVR